MPEVVPIALASWVVVCVALFWKLPGRDAALVALIGGWAILPVGQFPASVFARPVGSGGSVHALAIATALLVNKATAIGLGCLAGSMLFGWPALRRVRPSWVDLPIVVWCLVPAASAFANGLPLAVGLSQTRYQVLVWGVPYLMGRAYLTDSESLGRLGLGLVVAGVVYLPFCLFEVVQRPSIYALVYGPHPYQLEGMKRAVGYRPMVFQEHGNQLGMWVASAAVSAVWLWRARRLPAVGGVPAGAVAGGLVGLCLLCQSHTAVGMMAVGIAPALLPGRGTSTATGPRSEWKATAVVVLCAVLAVAAWAAVDPAARASVRGVFASIGKTSFTWRLARSSEYLSRVTQRPVLGWGQADWSQSADHTFMNPVNLGLGLLAAGMYGVVGLASLTALLVAPVAAALRLLPPRTWLSRAGSAVALTAVLVLINAIDSLFNSVWIMPLTAGAGGLSAWAWRKGRDAVEANGVRSPEGRVFGRRTADV